MLRVGARVGRGEPRRRVASVGRGLLAGLPRVNCWSIAEHAGERCPRGMQRLLSEAVWDEAGVRDDLRGYVLEHFADPAALATEMIVRALDAGTPAGWVAADEVYGQDPQLRAELARRSLGYVLAIRKSDPVLTPAGPLPACELAKRLPARAWQRLSAGPGAKGPRWYDWALIEASDPAVTEGGGPHWLLIRRRISDGELAFYRAHA